MRVQHVEGEYRIVVPAEAMQALNLTDGMPVSVAPLAKAPVSEHRDMSVSEMLEAYERTEHLHLETYQELAK